MSTDYSSHGYHHFEPSHHGALPRSYYACNISECLAVASVFSAASAPTAIVRYVSNSRPHQLEVSSRNTNLLPLAASRVNNVFVSCELSPSLVRLESRSDLYPETSNSANSRRAQSAPPRSGASSSCVILENSLNQKATVHDATNDECGPEEIVKSPGPQDRRKRVRFQDVSSQGDEKSDRDEDLESPSQKVKILATTWTCTSPPDASNYLNTRMLELSRITRRAFATRIRFQRLRSHELELMKSLADDEIEQVKTQINAIDLQIGSIEGMICEGEVDIESKGCSLSEDNIRMFSGDNHGSEASWREKDSCDVTIHSSSLSS
ncbi:hypothetical protein F4604DRAFT_1954020 [Suillus subluteus]|nr:hypothetical protein F4604DRAFT_1954020 [Suillus subluteus]